MVTYITSIPSHVSWYTWCHNVQSPRYKQHEGSCCLLVNIVKLNKSINGCFYKKMKMASFDMLLSGEGYVGVNLDHVEIKAKEIVKDLDMLPESHD